MSAIVLNVEDSFDDVLLLKRANRKAQTSFDLRFVADGELAIDYLSGRGDFVERSAHPLPTLILLDLNMPRKSGFEVLEWIKNTEKLREIPVAIFSSSTNEKDIRAAFERGADCYLAKPLSYEPLILLMQNIDQALNNQAVPLVSALHRLPECCRTI